MNSDIRTNISFCDPSDMSLVDHMIVSETLNTMSPMYYTTHPRFGQIRYFFSCFRDSVDYSGHLLVNSFLSEDGKIGLSASTSPCDIIEDDSFRSSYKENLSNYIIHLNDAIKAIQGIKKDTFRIDDLDDVISNCTDAHGTPLCK